METGRSDTRGLGPVLLGAIAAVVVYPLAHLLGPPLPRFLPAIGAWSMAPPEGAISIGYYGYVGAALLAGTLVYMVAALIPELRRRLDRRLVGLTRVLGAVTILLLLATFVREMIRWRGTP